LATLWQTFGERLADHPKELMPQPRQPITRAGSEYFQATPLAVELDVPASAAHGEAIVAACQREGGAAPAIARARRSGRAPAPDGNRRLEGSSSGAVQPAGQGAQRWLLRRQQPAPSSSPHLSDLCLKPRRQILG
jgi:hypothetical protein